MDKILIIEDERKIARFLELELTYEGYKVEIAYDGREGLNKADDESISMILLDVMLPELNGMEVLRRIRKKSEVPIIMLTAKDDVFDKVAGLDLGANDYMTKPFAIEELLARIRASIKRTPVKSEPSNVLRMGKLVMNSSMHTILYDDNKIELTKKEFDLLKYLIQNKNIVLTRERILSKIWDYDYFGGANTVDVHIRYLRKKIDEKFSIKLIQTIRGIGYVIRDE
ncbi:MAG: DNA-binding response regulator [Alkaliphilus sp.]|nr:response regulator transcription factor [bacterium AH-315-G05]MBN4074934.1 response regulator transcription factor [bacterium AH-315-E09]PHS36402.1 MAG: DNA-binding response regulator [Alkaliphilus sp.]